MRWIPCWSLQRFFLWFQLWNSSCVWLCSALRRTVKYDHIIWIINYSQHRVPWCTPIILMGTSQQIWRMGSRRKCQDSKQLWEHFWIFFVKTVLISSIRTDYKFPWYQFSQEYQKNNYSPAHYNHTLLFSLRMKNIQYSSSG